LLRRTDFENIYENVKRLSLDFRIMRGEVIHQLAEQRMIDENLDCFAAHRGYVAHAPDNLRDETVVFTVHTRCKENLENVE
jgi:hypothetical protein